MAAGLALLAFSAAVPSVSYTRFLLGDFEKDLSWGPTVFRVLLAFHGVLLIVLGWTRQPSHSSRSKDIQSEPRISLGVIVVLIALSVVALALRSWNLNSDLWLDEVLTLLDFVRKPMGQVLTSFPSQNQHMLFSIMAKASTAIFGESAASMRLPSVFFGVASIWAFFFLGRRLVGQTEALLGCALLTVSYHHIWFSQNARGYMGLLLFTLFATWCWLEALEKNDVKWWGAYSLFVVLGMWVNITMAFVVAAHAIVYVVLLLVPRLSGDSVDSLERKAGLKPIVSWILSVTVTLQVFALALPEFLSVGLHEESKESEWTHPLWVITESLKSLSIGFAGIAVVLIGGAFVAFGWFMLFKKDRRAAVIMVLPAFMAGSLMLLLGHNLWPRFFFFSMGFGLLIVIHGAMELPKVIEKIIRSFRQVPAFSSFVGVGAVVLLIVASMMTLPRIYALPKQDYSGAKTYVETHSSPADKRVAVSLAGTIYGRYLTPYWPVPETGRELEALQQSNDRVWLVYTIAPELRAFKPDIWQVIERDFEVTKVFPGTLNGGEIFVCQKKAATAKLPTDAEISSNKKDDSSK